MKEKWHESFTKPVSAPSQQGLLPLVADLLGLGQYGRVAQGYYVVLCSSCTHTYVFVANHLLDYKGTPL